MIKLKDFDPSEPDALKQESELLKYLTDLNFTNPKKLRKEVIKLYGQCQWDVQRLFCRNVLNAKNPIKYLEDCNNKVNDFAILMQEMINDSKHGVLFTGQSDNVVIPVTLDTVETWLTENKRWHPDDEYEIGRTTADNYYNTHPHDKGPIKIVLFPHFGFSGIPRAFIKN